MSKNIEEIAKQYVKKINRAFDKKKAAKEIVVEINELVYSKSDKPISSRDKEIIIKKMRDYLSGYRRVGNRRLIQDSDNKNYLELISYIKQQLSQQKD